MNFKTRKELIEAMCADFPIPGQLRVDLIISAPGLLCGMSAALSHDDVRQAALDMIDGPNGQQLPGDALIMNHALMHLYRQTRDQVIKPDLLGAEGAGLLTPPSFDA